ncbi:MAG: hypothetical protein ACTSUR_00650 [Candidatus Heimdallarchaeaceae archaeon]
MNSKELLLFLIFLTISSPLVYSYTNNEKNLGTNGLNTTISPQSIYSYDFNRDSVAFYQFTFVPRNDELTYDIEITNSTENVVFSRNNYQSFFRFYFIYKGRIKLQIINNNNEYLTLDLRIESEELKEYKDGGYYSGTTYNRFWNLEVKRNQLSFLELTGIKKGTYNVFMSVKDKGGTIGVYRTSNNPKETSNWIEDSIYMSFVDSISTQITFENDNVWFILSSLDNLSHSTVIGLVFVQGEVLTIGNIVFIVGFFIALLTFFAIRREGKRKRSARKFHPPQANRKRVESALRLSAQIDWRYEGGRYAYVPPDVRYPELLDSKVDDE